MSSLTKEQIKYIEGLLDHCEIKDLKKLNTSEELQLFASYHSRGGGEYAHQWVIKNSKCDRGTALMIYWRADPVSLYKEYAQEKEVPGHALDIYQTIKEIEKRIQSGFYKNHTIKYDPIKEGYLPQDFNPKKLKQDIPKDMFEFDKGELWKNPLKMGDH